MRAAKGENGSLYTHALHLRLLLIQFAKLCVARTSGQMTSRQDDLSTLQNKVAIHPTKSVNAERNVGRFVAMFEPKGMGRWNRVLFAALLVPEQRVECLPID